MQSITNRTSTIWLIKPKSLTSSTKIRIVLTLKTLIRAGFTLKTILIFVITLYTLAARWIYFIILTL